MSILVLKQEYNELLFRGLNGYIYLGDDTKSIKNRDQWVPEYLKIRDRLGEIMEELEANGVRMTEDEKWGGFNLEEESE